MKLSSPKLGLRKEVGPSAWYKFYAGFSSYFVADALRYFTTEGDSVLDPWNGGGTTTFVAKSLNRKVTGRDINPALIVIAKSKVLDPALKTSLIPFAVEIVDSSSRFYGKRENDGLNHWFTKATVNRIRSIEESVRKCLVPAHNFTSLSQELSLMTPLAAFYYVALFKVVRKLSSEFRTSNPTWIKIAKADAEKKDFTLQQIKKLFLKEVEVLEKEMDDLVQEKLFLTDDIAIGNSKCLDLGNDSVDCVITSPPYCTRIDYIRATLPELSVIMKSDPLQDDGLKLNTIGATTNFIMPEDESFLLGDNCEILLNKIYNHPSKASSTYYYKYFRKYFYNMMSSIKELHRVVKYDGNALLVVQDSYYKDISVDLPQIMASMGKMAGFSTEVIPLHKDNKPYSIIHRHAKDYRKKASATESVVVMRKTL